MLDKPSEEPESILMSTKLSGFVEGLLSVPRRAASSIKVLVSRQAATLLGLCLVVAIVAQYLVDERQSLGLAGGLYALAALLFVVLFYHERLEAEHPIPVAHKLASRWWLVALAALLGGLSFPRFTNNTFSAEGTLLWVLGLLLLGLASWSKAPQTSKVLENFQGRDGKATALPTLQVSSAPSVSGDSSLERKTGGITITWARLALLGIMLIGAFYRLYKIDLIPSEMGCDLPHIYNNTRYILRKEFLIFFPSHPGREGLFFYMAAPFCRLFGLTHTTIKISSALVGLLTLPVIYLLGKELFNREVGLYAAFFLSVSHWHVILSRTGLRSCTVPLMLSLVWYFLLRGLKTGRRWFYALAGFFLGLGLYSYNAFMIVPLMVVLMLLLGFLIGRGRTLLANWYNVVILVLVALYLFIPLARYAYDEPQSYGYRAATRVTSMEKSLPQDMLVTFSSNMRKSLLMFNYVGDHVAIANLPGYRELGFFAAVLFVLGLAYLLWHWQRGHNATVIISLVVMLLPSALALAFPNEVPNAWRATGAIPAAILAAAVALALVRRRVAATLAVQSSKGFHLSLSMDGGWSVEWRWRWSKLRHILCWAALVAVLAFEARAVYPFYFQEYLARLPNKNYSISLEMARAIDDFADDGQAYIKTAPYWYDGNAVRAQLRRADQSWHNEINNLDPSQPPMAGPPGQFMVILHPQDAGSLHTLQRAFPKGIALRHLDHDKEMAFLTFYGER